MNRFAAASGYRQLNKPSSEHYSSGVRGIARAPFVRASHFHLRYHVPRGLILARLHERAALRAPRRSLTRLEHAPVAVRMPLRARVRGVLLDVRAYPTYERVFHAVDEDVYGVLHRACVACPRGDQ